MLRRVWFTKPIEADAVLAEREYGRAPFALLVEYKLRPATWMAYLFPGLGRYRIKARIKPRNGEMAALIERHHLRAVDVYIDKAAEAVDKRQAALRDEVRAGFVEGVAGIRPRPDKLLTALWRWLTGYIEQQRVVRMSFGTLLDGIEVKGKMDELRWLVREMTAAVDKLGMQIEAGAAFDAGEIRIFAPGKRVKIETDRTGTPPAQWGR